MFKIDPIARNIDLNGSAGHNHYHFMQITVKTMMKAIMSSSDTRSYEDAAPTDVVGDKI